MPSLHDLVLYCDRRTRRAAFKDAPGAWNGLQVENDGRVTKIGAAVDAGVAPFRQAVAAGATALWLQLGIASAESRAIAADAGLLYVEDRCLVIEQRRLGIRDGTDAAHHSRPGDGRAFQPGQPRRLPRGHRGRRSFWPRLS